MAFVRRALGNWWVVTLGAALLAVLLLCVGLPLFVLVLRSWWIRLLLFALVAGVWGTFAFLKIRRARKAAAALEAAVTGDREGDLVAGRLRDALAQLKTSGAGRRDYLYARPWYVIIGPPGAGKTTALRASGLRFPAVDQAMKGAGGTRNLDFWFADEAVMVDTAGRYTTQDSDSAEDAAGWRGFLAAIKRNRPLQPINGVLVAIGLDEIASADRAAIDDHAGAVRRRLAELAETLDVEVPVYLLFTKADLVAGFGEYFADLDVEARRAVLGRTFAADVPHPDATALAQAFDETVQAVADRQPGRLAGETDLLRCSLILGYPAQLASLRARMVRFCEGAFPQVAPGAKSSGSLRGFYLTSGTQSGTPLDRLLAGMAEVYDRPQDASATASGGRAFFLNRLLTEVVFPEAGLVRTRAGAIRARRLRAGGAVAAIAAVAVLVALLWTVSFFRNRAEQSALADAGRAAGESIKQRGIDLVEVNGNDASLDEAVTVLDQLRALPGGYADRARGFPALTLRFGLWQRGLSDEAIQTYQQALRRILLPRLLLRMETVLAGAAGDPLAEYEPLKAYLTLGGQRPGGVDAKAVRSFVVTDWETGGLPGSDRADLRRRLATHLDALLEAGDFERVWANRQIPLDAPLVTTARATVQSLPPGDRAYAMLRHGSAALSGPDWDATRMVSPGDAVAFADGGAVLQLRVPFFFTRDGYTRGYRAALVSIPDQLRRDAWVLGGDGAGASAAGQLGEIRPVIAQHYAADYTAAWDKVVAAVKPGALFADQAALGAFTKMPSPFALLLREVRRNTSFDGKDMASVAAVGAGAKLTSMLGRAAPVVTAGLASDRNSDAGALIATHFAEVNAWVGDGKAPSPLDQFVDAIKVGGQAVLAARAGGAAGGATLQVALDQANATIALQAAQAPAALKDATAAAAAGGATAKSAVAQGNLQAAYSTTMLPACRSATQDKYPFFAAATADASVSDTVQVFGGGGGIGGFVDTTLRPLLDTAGPVWRWRSDDPAAATFDPGSADALAKTVQIHDLLTAGQAFKVQLVSTGPGVDAVEMAAGATNRFEAGSRAAKQYQWSLQGGLPEAHVTLFKAGQKVDEIDASGPWAIFRLFDKAQRQNDGQTAFRATFGSGNNSVTLRIILPDDRNPFSHGGLWTFRCPVAL